MTAFIIDAAIVLVVVFCAYRGFRKGLVRGVVGFLALILSLVIASTVSGVFADEFTGVLHPFVGGLVDSQIQKVLSPEEIILEDDTDDETVTDGEDGAAADGEDSVSDGEEAETPDGDETVENTPEPTHTIDATPHGDIIVDAPTNTFDLTNLILTNLGFLEPVSNKLSATIAEETNALGFELGDIITTKLCLTLSRIALFAIAFIILAMIFAILGNVIDVVLSLPGLRTVDQAAGTVMGILRALVVLLFITTILRYFGIIATDFIEKTTILEYMVEHNIIANALKM